MAGSANGDRHPLLLLCRPRLYSGAW